MYNTIIPGVPKHSRYGCHGEHIMQSVWGGQEHALHTPVNLHCHGNQTANYLRVDTHTG